MRSILLLLIYILSLPLNAANIMIIHSYHSDNPWTASYSLGLEEQLKPNEHITHVYLNSKRLPYSHYSRLAEAAWEAYIANKPDLVVLADDNAIALLSRRLSRTETPVVFLGLNTNPRDHQLQDYRNFTGVLERPLFKRSLLLIDFILPNKQNKKLLILSDTSPTSIAAFTPIIRNNETTHIGKIQLDFKLITSEKDWKETIIKAKTDGYDGLFIALYHTLTDEFTNHSDPQAILKWTAKYSPVPHFGFWDFNVSKEANIGGYVLDGYQHGKLASKLIAQILLGALPSSLPYVSDRKGQFMFSRYGVNKWHITLPKDIDAETHWVE
ncbi:ABC transporter substrate-binding protein [Shewanella algidipiscicola]|uniref:ABC transporter substrate-binding protein n=1 Tax=Shewanella algidipiscicola TaxID=614070 RepID=UPI000D7856D7|nr:ABC transporter substrate binding protein [Shewanella algidipiscicola]